MFGYSFFLYISALRMIEQVKEKVPTCTSRAPAAGPSSERIVRRAEIAA